MDREQIKSEMESTIEMLNRFISIKKQRDKNIFKEKYDFFHECDWRFEYKLYSNKEVINELEEKLDYLEKQLFNLENQILLVEY